MIALALSITGNALLFVILKSYPRWNIDTLSAIVFNYLTAGTLGLVFDKSGTPYSQVFTREWFPFCIALGCLFISIFILVAYTAQKVSVAASSVANKMSVIIPVCCAIYFFHDHLSVYRASGIALALAAVYLTSKKKEVHTSGRNLLLPFTVFIGSGAIDALINYAQHEKVSDAESSLFISTCFLTAFSIGVVITLYRVLFKKLSVPLKNVAGGIVLGIPNYASIFFFVKALNSKMFESSVIFPMNNVGVVLVSAALAFLLFREKLSSTNLVGVAIAALAIVLMSQNS
ncbi:MAG TPA: EamA/RhaT family transporter [Bacteroidia bacterium]|jgi:drug/metabolite transporter (DMT)-like permease